MLPPSADTNRPAGVVFSSRRIFDNSRSPMPGTASSPIASPSSAGAAPWSCPCGSKTNTLASFLSTMTKGKRRGGGRGQVLREGRRIARAIAGGRTVGAVPAFAEAIHPHLRLALVDPDLPVIDRHASGLRLRGSGREAQRQGASDSQAELLLAERVVHVLSLFEKITPVPP